LLDRSLIEVEGEVDWVEMNSMYQGQANLVFQHRGVRLHQMIFGIETRKSGVQNLGMCVCWKQGFHSGVIENKPVVC
jgi:hypothetical protein